MTRLKKIIAALAVVIPVSGGLSSMGAAETYNWKFQTFHTATAYPTLAFQEFAERLKQKTDGRISMEVFPVGGLVAHNGTMEAIQAGVLTGHYTASSYFAGKDPAFAVLGDTLAAYPDIDQRNGWFTEGGGQELASELYKKYGIHFIGNVYWPAEWIPSRKEIRAPSDFKGIKMRAPEGLVGSLLGHYGASVVALPSSDVYSALETGVLDATDWGYLDANLNGGFHDIADFAIFARHSMPVTEIGISEKVWADLPDDLKKIFEDEVAEFHTIVRAELLKREAGAQEKATAKGVTLIKFDETAGAEFRRQTLVEMDKWGSKCNICGRIVESHKAYLRKIGLLK